jgi:spermidine/putrescine transport system substrate-binding protein
MKHLMVFAFALALLAIPSGGSAAVKDNGEVVVFNWSEYIPSDILEQFTKETGIRVIYSTYETNDSMYTKVKLMQGKAYDLVCPSTYYVNLMIDEGLLTKFDHSKLPNLGNLDPQLMSPPYDPKNEYGIPYMWGSLGMIINTKLVNKEHAKTWKDMLRPEYKGKILLTDEMRDAFGIALHAIGKSANSTSEEDIIAGYEFLRELHPSVRVFDTTAIKQAFISEEVVIGSSWNGDALIAQQENPNLEYIYPEDGALTWVDSFVMPKRAPNIDNAHAFVNFLLRPEIAKRCQEEYMYSTPNLETIKLMTPEERSNPTLVPTDKELKHVELLMNVGAKAMLLYSVYWEKLKSGAQ